jgi:hypothetical protein
MLAFVSLALHSCALTLVWLPGAAAIVCLLIGITNWGAYWFAIAAVGGVFTFLGWCFGQGMEEPKPWK